MVLSREAQKNESQPITIDIFAGDGVLNLAESKQSQWLSGTAKFPEDSEVQIVFNRKKYTTKVGEDGRWAVEIPAADMANIRQNTNGVLVRVIDKKTGTSHTHSSSFEADTVAPEVTVDFSIGGDKIINASEKELPIVLTGTASKSEAGKDVLVQLNGQEYKATVQKDGSWATFIPAEDVIALAEGEHNLQVTLTDWAGNSTIIEDSLRVDTTSPELAVSPITGDDLIGVDEASKDLVITGQSDSEAGQTVTVLLNGESYSGVVDNYGSWQVIIPAEVVTQLADGSYTLTVSTTDQAGNTTTVEHDFKVDRTAVSLEIAPIAEDDIINAAEAAQDVVISGTTAESEAGQAITIQLGEEKYSTIINEDGTWSIVISSDVVQQLPQGEQVLTVSLEGSSGTVVTVEKAFIVDTVAPELTLNAIAGNDVVNAGDIAEGLLIGGVASLSEVGQVVTVELSGLLYQAVVNDEGNWVVAIPAEDLAGLAEGGQSVKVTLADSAGNVTELEHGFTLDTVFPTFTINDIAEDNIINWDESRQELYITGSATEQGTVEVTVNGVNYQGEIASDGSWSITIPVDALNELAEGPHILTVTVTDLAGNAVSQQHSVVIDTVSPELTVNFFNSDNVISHAVSQQPLEITGTASVSEAGQSVVLTWNGQEYSGTVQSDGSWAITLSVEELANLPQGDSELLFTLTDQAGNITTADMNAYIDTILPVCSVDSITEDNIINAAEKQPGLLITGTVADEGTDADVSIYVSIGDWQGTISTGSGSWSIALPQEALAQLVEGENVLQLTIIDKAGNIVEQEHSFSVDSIAPEIVIDEIDTLNLISIEQPLTITGSTAASEAGQTVYLTLNKTQYESTVQEDGSWSITISVEDLATLPQDSSELQVTITDSIGNIGVQVGAVVVDTIPPVLTIEPITGDNIINAAEIGNVVVTGTAPVTEAGHLLIVVLQSQQYETRVGEDGKWSINIPEADLAQYEGENELHVILTDLAGNVVVKKVSFIVDTIAPELNVDAIAGDDIINIAESQQELIITGTTSPSEVGQTVVIELNDNSYKAVVGEEGNWSVVIPQEDVAALNERDYTAQISIADQAGNTTVVNKTFSVDKTSAALIVDTIAEDDIINGEEIQQDLVISGVALSYGEGKSVTVTFAGKVYETTVIDAEGNWSVTIPADELVALEDSQHIVTVTLVDAEFTVTKEVTVDTVAPIIQIDPLTDDNIINAAEAQEALTITGTAPEAVSGVIELNDLLYQLTVNEDGSWSVTIPADAIAALPEGEQVFLVTLTDLAGNSSIDEHSFFVDTVAPEIVVDAITGDDIINAAEAEEALIVTVTAPEAVSGVVELNGQKYELTLSEEGNWLATIPADVVAALPETEQSITVTVQDLAGNSTTQSHNFTVDKTAPELTINTIAGDDIINNVEAQEALTITGTAPEAVSGVVELNGEEYVFTVQEDGRWSVTIPADAVAALPEESGQSITVTVTDQAGNSATDGREFTVDKTAPELIINTIAEDDIINAAEIGEDLLVSGSASSDEAGRPITVELNSKKYPTTVGDDGSWSVTIPTADLGKLNEGSNKLSVTLVGKSGNVALETKDVTVDTVAPTVKVAPLTGDDIINAAEAEEALIVTVTAPEAVSGVVELNGQKYELTLSEEGNWLATIPANAVAALPEDGNALTVTVQDLAGNSTTQSHNFTVDKTAPELTINTIAEDDIINNVEAQEALTITGTAPEAVSGVIVFNDKEYNLTIDAEGNWSVTIPADAVAALPEGDNALTVTVQDLAGNSTTQLHDFTVDKTAPELTINTIAGDDIINAAEIGEDLLVSGSASSDEAGQPITVELNSKKYPTTVGDDGSWSVTIPTADLGKLNEGSNKLSVTLVGKSGNVALETKDVTVDTVAPTVKVAPLTGDDIINAAEAEEALIVTVTAPEAVSGVVELNGQKYELTLSEEGNWLATIPADVVAALPETEQSITVTVQDLAGNSTTQSHNFTVDKTAPELTINTIAGDDIINNVEAQEALIITGTALKAVSGVVELNGEEYVFTVQEDGRWSVTIPADAVAALPEESGQSITVTVQDLVGNSTEQGHKFKVDKTAPELTINPIADDNIINAAEAQEVLTITGTAPEAVSGVIVFNDKEYNLTIDAEGNWSVTILADVVAALPEIKQSITVTVTDQAGNSATKEHNFTVDKTAPELIVDKIADDNILDRNEMEQDLSITGKASTSEAGREVTVVLNSKSYFGEVGAEGNWSVNILAQDLQALTHGENKLTVELTDQAGNTTIVEHQFDVDIAPVIKLDAFAGDNSLSYEESQQSQLISGTTKYIPEGTAIIIYLGNQEYKAKVENNKWQVEVSVANLAKLFKGEVELVAGLYLDGKWMSTVAEITVEGKPAPKITIDPFAGDDYLDPVEQLEDGHKLSGHVENMEAGEWVTVVIDDYFDFVQIDEKGNWELLISKEVIESWAVGTVTISVEVMDDEGNMVEMSRDIEVLQPRISLTIDFFAGDNILDYYESQTAQIVSGTAKYAKAGDELTIQLAGKTYKSQVDEQGGWEVEIPAADLQALPKGENTITVWIQDDKGIASEYIKIKVEGSPEPTITFKLFAGDDVLNPGEEKEAQVLSGNVSYASDNKIVSVFISLDGKNIGRAMVDKDGNWQLPISANRLAQLEKGEHQFKAIVTLNGGRQIVETKLFDVEGQTAKVTLDPFAGDNTLDFYESLQTQTVSGEINEYAKQGDLVEVTLNDETYKAQVGADGKWSVDILSEDLRQLQDGLAVLSAKISGEGDWSAAQQEIKVAIHVDKSITIDPFTGDNELTSVEAQDDQVLSGSSTGLEPGEVLFISLNGLLEYHETEVGADGRWEVKFLSTELQTLAAGAHSIDIMSETGCTGEATITVKSAVEPEEPEQAFLISDEAASVISSLYGEQNEQPTVVASAVKDAGDDGALLDVNGEQLSLSEAAGGTWSKVGQGELAVGEPVSGGDSVHAAIPATPVEQLQEQYNPYVFG